METSHVLAVPYAPLATPLASKTTVPTRHFFRTSYFPLKEIVVSKDVEVELGRCSDLRPPSQRQRYEFLSPIVSMVHARIGADENGVFLVDVGTSAEGSRHGTFLNGSRIKSLTAYYLVKGDLISLGNPRSGMSVTLVLAKQK